VVEAKEIKALAPFPEVHDPRLGLLELKAKLGQDRRERRKRPFGLLPAVAEHQQIVRVTRQHPAAAICPLPVEPVQVDVGEAG
jgi:hypothetical protein